MNSASFRVLLIDDDAQVGLSIKRALRATFDITLAEDGAAALLHMRDDEPFPLVICDLRLPGMNGLTLLQHVRQHWPDSILIILSGETQFELAVAALNSGHVFRFLTKPFDINTLRNAMFAAERLWTKQQRNRDRNEDALRGSVELLMNVLEVVSPSAFARAGRVAAHARQLAIALGLPDAARVGLAARLSQLGVMMLSASQQQALADGTRIAPEDFAEIQRVPFLAVPMLCELPPLKDVRRIMIAAGSYEVRGQISAAASVVRLVLRLDVQTHMQLDFDDIMAAISAESAAYPIETLQAARALFGASGHETLTRTILLSRLEQGMILLSDVRAPDGLLLAARGQCVTSTFLGRAHQSWADFAALQTVEVELHAGA